MRVTSSILAVVCWFALTPHQSAGQAADVLRRIQDAAGAYPVRAAMFFGQDSAVIDVEDSTLTQMVLEEGLWSFGGEPSEAYLDGCASGKVLGFRIARALWRSGGKERGVGRIIVRVHGPRDSSGTTTSVGLFYHAPDLERPWAGDRAS